MGVKISLDMICSSCGQTFLYEKEFPNGLEAEKGERRLNKAIMKCRDCYIATRKEEETERLDSLQLPQVHGVSEKQVQYAVSLRRRYILENPERIDFAKSALKRIQPELLYPAANKRNLSVLDCIPEAFRRMRLEKEYACLSFTDAKRLIDALKISP